MVKERTNYARSGTGHEIRGFWHKANRLLGKQGVVFSRGDILNQGIISDRKRKMLRSPRSGK